MITVAEPVSFKKKASDAGGQLAEARRAEAQPTLKTKSILLVEDERATRSTISTLLIRRLSRLQGLEVDVDAPKSPEEIEKFISSRKYDLILLDGNLGLFAFNEETDGPKVARKIRDGTYGGLNTKTEICTITTDEKLAKEFGSTVTALAKTTISEPGQLALLKDMLTLDNDLQRFRSGYLEDAISGLSAEQKAGFIAILKKIRSLSFDSPNTVPLPSWKVYQSTSFENVKSIVKEVRFGNDKHQEAERAERNVALYSRHDMYWNKRRFAQRALVQEVARKTLEGGILPGTIVDYVCEVVAIGARFYLTKDTGEKEFKNKAVLTRYVNECMTALDAGYIPLGYEPDGKFGVYALSDTSLQSQHIELPNAPGTLTEEKRD